MLELEFMILAIRILLRVYVRVCSIRNMETDEIVENAREFITLAEARKKAITG